MNRKEIDAAITVAEQFAEGTRTEVELLYIYDGQIPWNDEYVAAIEACNPDAGSGAHNSVRPITAIAQNDWAKRHPEARKRSKESRAEKTAQSVIQTEIIREIFANPFRPISINPNWLTSTVSNLASIAYEERTMPSGPSHRGGWRQGTANHAMHLTRPAGRLFEDHPTSVLVDKKSTDRSLIQSWWREKMHCQRFALRSCAVLAGASAPAN